MDLTPCLAFSFEGAPLAHRTDEHSWVWQAFLEGFLKNFATQNREAFGMVANMLPSLEQRFLIDLLKRLASS